MGIFILFLRKVLNTFYFFIEKQNTRTDVLLLFVLKKPSYKLMLEGLFFYSNSQINEIPKRVRDKFD